MKLTYGETLPEGVYMMWRCDTAASLPALLYFEQKYGYVPSRIVVADNVEIDADDWGLEIHSTGKKVQPGHILLR